MKSFVSYLNGTADRLPDKLAFSDGEYGLTFRELRQTACSRFWMRWPAMMIRTARPFPQANALG